MAGNSRSGQWMLVPTWFGKSNHRRGFVILRHVLNQQKGGEDIWQRVNQQVRVGIPRALTVVAGRANGQEVSSAYVMFSGGMVWAYGKDLRQSVASLPPTVMPVAAAGSSQGLYVLVYGVPAPHRMAAPTAMTMTRDELSPNINAKNLNPNASRSKQPPSSQPSQPTTSKTTLPSAKPNPPVSPRWMVYQFNGVHWHRISSPGLAIDRPAGDVIPPVAAQLVWQAGRLWAFWRNPAHARQLSAQYLPIGQSVPAVWSGVLHLTTAEPQGVVLAVNVDGRIVVLSVIRRMDGNIEIHGARLRHVGKGVFRLADVWKPVVMLAGKNRFSPLNVAAAADGDAVAVVCMSSSGILRQITLNRRGRVLAPAFNIKPETVQPASPENIQSLMMVALMVLLALSLWQRQQLPAPGTLPAGMTVARLYQRIPAAAIDLAIPMVIVAVMYGAMGAATFVAMLRHWASVYSSPVLFAHEPSLWWMLGLYVTHVTVCECIFGRSIGKMFFRLRVVNLEGGRPGVVPLLVRNFLRLPELALVVLLIFMVVSTERQRLGDLLARTLVVHIT